jgi:hypothetical protein
LQFAKHGGWTSLFLSRFLHLPRATARNNRRGTQHRLLTLLENGKEARETGLKKTGRNQLTVFFPWRRRKKKKSDEGNCFFFFFYNSKRAKAKQKQSALSISMSMSL